MLPFKVLEWIACELEKCRETAAKGDISFCFPCSFQPCFHRNNQGSAVRPHLLCVAPYIQGKLNAEDPTSADVWGVTVSQGHIQPRIRRHSVWWRRLALNFWSSFQMRAQYWVTVLWTFGEYKRGLQQALRPGSAPVEKLVEKLRHSEPTPQPAASALSIIVSGSSLGSCLMSAWHPNEC